MRKNYIRVNIFRCVNAAVYFGVQIKVWVLNCVRMGFITRSIYVCKEIIPGLKPVHLSFLYLQNKEMLLQCVLVELWQQRRIM